MILLRDSKYDFTTAFDSSSLGNLELKDFAFSCCNMLRAINLLRSSFYIKSTTLFDNLSF